MCATHHPRHMDYVHVTKEQKRQRFPLSGTYIHYITKGYFERSSKKLVQYITRFYCDTTATELIVPTNKIYKLFKEKYKFDKNIHIIPTGIEVERFFKENIDDKQVRSLRKTIGISRRDFTILFVGRLAEEKNIEFLINSQKKLVDKHNNIKPCHLYHKLFL